uniref:Uncharacterized protein n=1 Tax=Arion vulgaris TaxID=1028688 RepID=A0A0B6ZRZ1_9EUPU
MGCCKSKELEVISRKISVLGNDRVGKSCLIQRYVKDEYDEDTPSAFIPSALQVDEKDELLKNGQTVHLFVYDLGGKESFKHLKRLNYPRSDAAIICFSIDDKESLEAVTDSWVQDIRKISPDIPILLVGLKKDKREEAASAEVLVQEKNGRSVAKKNNMLGYIECSSMTGEGVKEIFATIAREAAKRQTIKSEDV